METAKKHLVAGLKLLDSVEFRLKGEEITRVAMVRQEIQNAYAALEKAQKLSAEAQMITEDKKAEVKANG